VSRPGRVGLVSLGVGLTAAAVGAVAGLATERLAVRRGLDPGTANGPGAGTAGGGEAGGGSVGGGATGPDVAGLGQVRGVLHPVVADDGTALHVEVDEPDAGAAPAPTVVFCHGYALTCDSWHFQRIALRGRYRLVFWDHRGHGRSPLGPPAGDPTAPVSLERVGQDLGCVLDAVVPRGPVVLVGHSMGGMSIMSLLAQRPSLVTERLVGVALVATSAGGLARVDLGLPGLGPVIRRLAPPVTRILARTPGVEAGRRLGSDLESLLVRRYSYASPVPADLVQFTARMISTTSVAVISRFLPAFAGYDGAAALDLLDGVPVLVLAGDADVLIPPAHSEAIAEAAPWAEFVLVHEAGHLVMLEHPDLVTVALRELVDRALLIRGEGRHRRGTIRPRRTVIAVRPGSSGRAR